MKQLESCFKWKVTCNKYQPELKTLPQNRCLNYLIDRTFQGVTRLFILPFVNETDGEVQTKYYLPKAEIKDYKIIIVRGNFFDNPIKKDFKTYDDIKTIATGQGDDYTTQCLLRNMASELP